MPKYIIHKEGAYNFYTTVADGACFEEALTLAEVEQVVAAEAGDLGLKNLSARLARAHASGCSGHNWTLGDCISANKNGPHETHMPEAEFILRFLTLPDAKNGERL